MAHVDKAQSKKAIRYRARWRDMDGRDKALTFDRKLDADRFAAKVQHDLNAGGYIDPHAGRITVREYGEQWSRGQLQHAASTARDVEGGFRVHVYPTLGDRPLGSLRPSDIQGWVGGLTATLGPATTTKTYSFLATMLKAAVRDGLVAKTPCVDIKLPRVPKKRVVPMTVEQVEKLLDAVPEHYRPLLHFMAGTGVRAREAFGLSVDRVDFLRRQATIDRQLASRNGEPAWKQTKTPSSVRTLPLDDGVVEALANHLALHPATTGGLIFTTPEGRALDLNSCYGSKGPGSLIQEGHQGSRLIRRDPLP